MNHPSWGAVGRFLGRGSLALHPECWGDARVLEERRCRGSQVQSKNHRAGDTLAGMEPARESLKARVVTVRLDPEGFLQEVRGP